MTNLYTLPREVEEALEKYYACFDQETGELCVEQSEFEAAQAVLEDLKNRGDDLMNWYLQDRANRIARQEMIKAEIDRLMAQSDRETKKIDRIENMIDVFFQRVYDGKPINFGTFTLSYRKSDAVVIEDETRIPAEFMKTPEPPAPRPDKTAIKEAIKNGTEIPGASIESRKNLQIK